MTLKEQDVRITFRLKGFDLTIIFNKTTKLFGKLIHVYPGREATCVFDLCQSLVFV